MSNSTLAGVREDKSQIIHEILYKLENELEKFMKEIQKSYALYKIGQKTDFIKQIEKMVDAPFEHLIGISNEIDSKMIFFIDNIVSNFFKVHKDSIKEAYKLSTTNQTNLYYLIVLAEDTIEKRQNIFTFLDNYELTEFAKKYQVNFKFINSELVSGFNIEKNIDL